MIFAQLIKVFIWTKPDLRETKSPFINRFIISTNFAICRLEKDVRLSKAKNLRYGIIFDLNFINLFWLLLWDLKQLSSRLKNSVYRFSTWCYFLDCVQWSANVFIFHIHSNQLYRCSAALYPRGFSNSGKRLRITIKFPWNLSLIAMTSLRRSMCYPLGTGAACNSGLGILFLNLHNIHLHKYYEQKNKFK